MSLSITPSGQVCGAEITGLDLTQALDEDTIEAIRAAWMEHHVLSFPDQPLSDDDLERFSLYFGDFGQDPFIAAIEGREHVIAVERKSDEKAPLFAENWHTDWSFQATPPAGTCLFGITIPPQGGDTLYADQHKSLAAMPAELRQKLAGKLAIHSAKRGYSPDGVYGDADAGNVRAMRIVVNDTAYETQTHPFIRVHDETGEESLYGIFGYICGIEGMSDEDADELLLELYAWQIRDEFRYVHHWEPNMLVMWDNRTILHKATGGYDGHERLLHRTTIGAV
jgi:taurine dioxygenase